MQGKNRYISTFFVLKCFKYVDKSILRQIPFATSSLYEIGEKFYKATKLEMVKQRFPDFMLKMNRLLLGVCR
jgi:hypothetical protein